MLVAAAVAGSVSADEASAIKSVKALGGKVPGGGVVNLDRSKVTDRDLLLLLEFKEVGFLGSNDTAISDAGQVMPQKSTFFSPKLRSGLVIHSLREVTTPESR